VHLGSIDEIDKPLIDPRFYLVDFDVVVMTAIGRLARKFWSSDPVRAFVTGQLMPDPEVLPPNATDSQWRGFLRDNREPTCELTGKTLLILVIVIPNSHALGTASMMAKELGGVVDPELRVYGTANVRVVDASVMPLQISGHLTATIYALAERAVDIIKRDGREKSLE
jgi:choline dehydrogenase